MSDGNNKPKQSEKKQKKPVPKQKKNKPRKRNNRRPKDKKNIDPESRKLITPIQDLKLAQGALQVINVPVNLNPTSVLLIPVGLISQSLSQGATDPYAVYTAIIEDILNILLNGTGTATTRIQLYNYLFATLVQKSVPFGRAEIMYVLNNVGAITPSQTITVDGGFTYYMWVPTSTMVGEWTVQEPSGPYSPEDVASLYSQAINLVAGKKPHNMVSRDVQLKSLFIKDVSAFGQVSVYYGMGGGVGAPSYSVEWEVPVRSRMLGTLVQFNPETPRVLKVLDLSSGDSCSNWNIGLLDEFPVNYYMGAVSPIYKFLDLYELAHLLCLSLVQAIESKLNSATVLSDEDMDILTNGLNVTWSQWIISLRQQVLWMFNRSQNIAQFLTPQTGTGAFQPFLCGSNCYPAMPTILMKIPKFINENLRMLMMCVRPYHTGKFDSPNNNMTHVPVWGMYTTYTPVNYVIFQGATAHDLFLPEVSNNPSVFDGSYGSNVADFNNSDIVTSGINFWNEIVNACSNQFGELDTMGGDSMGSPLLQYTRYVAFSSTFLKKRSRS